MFLREDVQDGGISSLRGHGILPMLRYKTLSKHPERFRRLSGVTLEEFDELKREIKPKWERLRREKLDKARPKRKRIFGGGRKSKLRSFEDELLLLLVFYRLYPTVFVLGLVFGLDDSNVCRHLEILEAALAKARITWLKKPKRIKKISSIEEVFEKYPELEEIIVDGTEQPIQRPKQKNKRKTKAKQKKYYSGKKRRHTIKHQITVKRNGEIYDISDSHPGKAHDKTIFEKEKTKDKIPKGIKLRGDKGYQGIQKDRDLQAGVEVILPKKANRWHKLTKSDKRRNRKLAKERIIVEHTIRRLKIFQVLSQRYRHQLEKNNQTFKNIAAISNMKLALAEAH